MAEDLPSKSQLDKLGDRLRAGSRDEADLRALDEYRRSFRSAYDTVVGTIREELGLEGTGRPAKTTGAIVDKLNRQKIRLTQIQDVAGLRLITDDVIEQDRLVERLSASFSGSRVEDRRVKPSHGYRAVHLVVPLLDRLVEIQIRTREQHLWAELSEKLADVIDPAVKYGGGPAKTREMLLNYSSSLADAEILDAELAVLERRFSKLRHDTRGLQDTPENAEILESINALERDILNQKGRIKRRIKEVAKLLGEAQHLTDLKRPR